MFHVLSVCGYGVFLYDVMRGIDLSRYISYNYNREIRVCLVSNVEKVLGGVE